MTIPYYGVPLNRKRVPHAQLAPDFSLSRDLKEKVVNGQTVYEFIGADDFGADWYNRITFEVDQGRDEVPLLYEPIYDIVNDPNLPETQTIKSWAPGGFVFEEIFEGGEVKFGQVTSSEVSVSQRQFAVGVEYTKKLIMFNQLWEIARIERAVGKSHNALLNHLHLSPILDYTYTAANQTAANTAGSTTTEDWFLTLEDAIVASQADTTNPRMGPYVLMIHPSETFMVQRMLSRVPQEGFRLDSSASDFITGIIGYSGWTGTRGKKTVTYTGVTPGTGYLINTAYQSEDFVSLVKQSLESAQGNADVSRFVLQQIVWDVWLGIYANPLRAVEEITWPS